MSTPIRNLRTFAFSLCLILTIQIIALAQQAASGNVQLNGVEVHRLVMSGYRLSAAEAEQLEKSLLTDPKDLSARISLVAYYTSSQSDEFRTRKCDHALWLMRNIPDSEVLHEVAYLRMGRYDLCFGEARQLWLKNLETYPNNLTVLANAADFFMLSDQAQATKLLQQLATADPKNPRWPSELGHALMLEMQDAGHKGAAADMKNAAAGAYQAFVQAYKLTNDSLGKRALLPRLATTAYESGDTQAAQLWALEALEDAAKNKNDRSVADSVHHAHITLGRIALLSGDLPEARSHLLQSGQSQGSPVLGSFGPNMMLAKELLEKGERDPVLQYFQECASFWKNDHGQLAQWTATVKGGGIPNFGANLIY